MATLGFGTAEVKKIFSRAEEICRQIRKRSRNLSHIRGAVVSKVRLAETGIQLMTATPADIPSDLTLEIGRNFSPENLSRPSARFLDT
jgi:hypothetical protein